MQRAGEPCGNEATGLSLEYDIRVFHADADFRSDLSRYFCTDRLGKSGPGAGLPRLDLVDDRRGERQTVIGNVVDQRGVAIGADEERLRLQVPKRRATGEVIDALRREH